MLKQADLCIDLIARNDLAGLMSNSELTQTSSRFSVLLRRHQLLVCICKAVAGLAASAVSGCL
jgi:hypothetical protein